MASRHGPGGFSDGGSMAPAPPGNEEDGTACAKSPSEDSTMPKKDKVRGWSKKDVARWLEKRNLVKFVPLFLKNGVVGSDLVESKLAFLYEQEVLTEDREQILGEIYILLHPESPTLLRRSTPSPSLRSIHPKDREKYQAALQVAQSPPTKSPSMPLVTIGPRSRSPGATSAPPSTLTLPPTKPRSRSESGVETVGPVGPLSPPPGRKYLKRKSTPAVHDYLQRGIVQNASLFDTLQGEGQVCLHCVKVHRSQAGSKFGFSYQTLPDNCLLVTNIKSSSVPLHIGDRILEVNGIMLPGHKGSTVDNVLCKSASLDVVVVRHMIRSGESESARSRQSPSQHEKLEQELVMGEVRWQSLRHLLTSLQHKSFDPMTLTGTLTGVDDLQDMKKHAQLEMEVEDLQRNCTDLSNRVNSLHVSLKAKEEELSSMKKERDRAVDTLRTRLLKYCSPPKSSGRGGSDGDDDDLPRTRRTVETSQDLHALFFEHIESNLAIMETSDASKEDVLAVLRELTQATRRHAQFVDHLISFVYERAPWMIDELNVLQDASELPDTAADPPSPPPPPTPVPRTSPALRGCDEERVIVV